VLLSAIIIAAVKSHDAIMREVRVLDGMEDVIALPAVEAIQQNTEAVDEADELVVVTSFGNIPYPTTGGEVKPENQQKVEQRVAFPFFRLVDGFTVLVAGFGVAPPEWLARGIIQIWGEAAFTESYSGRNRIFFVLGKVGIIFIAVSAYFETKLIFDGELTHGL
jgi:hypothetical protein